MCFSFVGWFCYGEWFCWVVVRKGGRVQWGYAPAGKSMRGCDEAAARGDAQSPRIHRQHREHIRTGISGHGSVLSSNIKKKHNRTITRNPHKINRKSHFFPSFSAKKGAGAAPCTVRRLRQRVSGCPSGPSPRASGLHILQAENGVHFRRIRLTPERAPHFFVFFAQPLDIDGKAWYSRTIICN